MPELMVAAALLLMIMGVLLGLWQTGRAQGERVDLQLEASRNMAQLLVSLEEDLAHLLPGPRLATHAQPKPVHTLTFARVPSGSHGVSGLPLAPGLVPQSERVNWVFEPAAGRVFRNEKAMVAGPFSDVTFTYIPAGIASGDVLKIAISCPAPAGSKLSKITRTFTRLLAVATAYHQGEDWVGP
jgi:hypothetical protein